MADNRAAAGLWNEAIGFYQKAIKIAGPDEIDAIRLNYGAALMDAGQVEAAIIEFSRVTHQKPKWAAGWNNLGNELAFKGELKSAMVASQEVLKRSHKIAETHANLARLCNETGDFDAAASHAIKAIEIQPGLAAAWFQLGRTRFELNELSAAEEALNECLKHGPKAAGAYALLGSIFEQRGEMRNALDAWNQCLQIQPRHAAVLGRMATRLGHEFSPELQSRMEVMIDEPGLKDAEREAIGYGLAHQFDLNENYRRAVTCLYMACEARERGFKIAGRSYDQNAFENRIAGLRLALDTREVSGLKFESSCFMKSPRMIFIVGMPRSGTSLVEQILATHPAIRGAGELTCIPELVSQAMIKESAGLVSECQLALNRLISIRQEYDRRIAGQYPNSVCVIDKLPDNYYYVPLLRILFPDALIIECTRDARDLSLSCRMTRFESVRWNSAWGNLVARFEFYQRVKDSYSLRPELNINTIRYESHVADLETAIQPLFDQLQLEIPAAVDRFHDTKRVVRTASTGQARRPLYQSSIGRWKHYEFAYGSCFNRLASSAGSD